MDMDSDLAALQSQIENALSGQTPPSSSQLSALQSKLILLEEKLDSGRGGGEEVRRRRALLRRLKSQLESVARAGHRSAAGVQRSSQQRAIMEEHSALVSNMERGVGRLHNQANLIHQEATLHVRLLDEMDIDVDKASEGLRQEARHAEKIRQKSKTFWLYVTIIILFVILVLLISIGL